MEINFKARHMELDHNIADYSRKRMEKITKLLPETAFLEIEFIDEFGARGGVDKLVQVDLSIPGEKKTVHLENSAPDWQTSIDLLQERLEKEIVRWREKNRDAKRHPIKYKVAEKEERESGELS